MELKDVEKLARLARIEMSEAEQSEFARNMESILGYIGQIQSVSAEIGGQKIGTVYNVMREDANPNQGGLYTEALLAEALETKDGYVKVKRIL